MSTVVLWVFLSSFLYLNALIMRGRRVVHKNWVYRAVSKLEWFFVRKVKSFFGFEDLPSWMVSCSSECFLEEKRSIFQGGGVHYLNIPFGVVLIFGILLTPYCCFMFSVVIELPLDCITHCSHWLELLLPYVFLIFSLFRYKQQIQKLLSYAS